MGENCTTANPDLFATLIELFPGTRLSTQRQAVDDPLKPDEALSDTQRKFVNDWYQHPLQSVKRQEEGMHHSDQIQALIHAGVHAVKQYKPKDGKTMRMHSVTAMIENGLVHLPEKAAWLGEHLHELTNFPNAKYGDQADSTSQALDWFKQSNTKGVLGLHEYFKQETARMRAAGRPISDSPALNRGAPLRERDRRLGRFGDR